MVKGKILLSDPGDDKPKPKEVFSMGIEVRNCHTGKWGGLWEIVDFGDQKTKKKNPRVTHLIAYHKDTPMEKLKKAQWKKIKAGPFSVGVDAGMAGVFDFDSFPDEADLDSEDSLYNRAIEVTVGRDFKGKEDEGGCLKEGVVTNSGWGDGMYPAFQKTLNQKVVAVKIVFISKEEQEEILQQ